jgi:hypothetical protein
MIEEVLDMSFSVQSVLYQGKGDYLFPELLIIDLDKA